MKRLLVGFLLLFAFSSATSQTLSPVSLDDWTDPTADGWEYRAVERFYALGLVSDIPMNTRPWTREQMAGIIASVNSRVQSGEIALSLYDSRRLEWLNRAYADLMSESDSPTERRTYWPQMRLRHNDGYTQIGGQMFVLGYRLDSDLSDDATAGLQSRFEVQLDAGWGRTWSFHERIAVERFTDDLPFDNPPRRGLAGREWRGLVGNVDVATITARLPWGRVWVGRDRLKWGAGARGSMIVSHNAAPLDLVATEINVGRFMFTGFTALLEPNIPRWLSAHRVSAELWRGRAEIGLTEASYYAERDLDFRYLVAIMPYYAIQWADSSNKDNLLLGVDGRIVPTPGLSLYGELVIDDFQVDAEDRGQGGDKLGVTVGLHSVDPFGLSGTELRAEYVRVNTATYTHYNLLTTADSDGWPVGHWLGPDGDDLYLSASVAVTADIVLTLSFDRMRRGEVTLADSLGYLPGNLDFPSGVVETSTTWSGEIRYRPIERFEAYARTSLTSLDNADHVDGRSESRNGMWAGVRLGF
jgi:hypothetical protein